MYSVRTHLAQDENETLPLVKGIPIPKRKGPRHSKETNTIRKMDVGQSFLAEKGATKGRESWFHAVARKYDRKITVRTVSDTHVRVWRVK